MKKTANAPILITGASRRIGFHCAMRLAEEGHSVITSHHCEAASIELLRQKNITSLIGDFSSVDGIHAFIQLLGEQTDQLRAVVHNASIWISDSAMQMDSIFDQVMNIHVRAPWLINYAAEPLLLKYLQQNPSAYADIIHITDDVVRTGSKTKMIYSASKAAAENLILSFAAQMAPRIKVNAIAPALIMFNDHDGEDYRQRALKKSVLQIEPGPEVVYQSLRYLLSCHYITGTVLPLQGGRHLLS